jgi:hypothetical protein
VRSRLRALTAVRPSRPSRPPKPPKPAEPSQPGEPSGSAEPSGPAEPAKPAEPSGPPEPAERLRGGGRHYFTASVASGGLVALIWLLVVRPDGQQAPPRVDITRQAAHLRAVAPYQTYVPRGLPAGWLAISSRITGTPGDGPVAWHLGFRTARGEYAAVEESDEDPGGFVPRMANRDRPVGAQQVAGATWERYYRPDKKQYSLARRLPGVTLVVTGTASYDELAALAAALRPQPRP